MVSMGLGMIAGLGDHGRGRSRYWFGREQWIRGVGSPIGSNGEEGPLLASIV
ncbi:hypothetical protein NC651_028973 [Populus alba x Populus x berolinensis]|nr:hypothetical protein NC651_028973 [Populus alba x Populus x berolinensis]